MTAVITSPAATVLVRELDAADVDELIAMHDRCSPESRFRRWHGHLRVFPKSYLAALLAGDGEQLTVVAYAGDRMVGFASAARTADTTRELGVLVEDAWQRRGIGRLLIDAVVALCRSRGTTLLAAEVLAADARLLDVLRHYGDGVGPARLSHGVLRADVRLTPG